jgi:hypothetical protein
MNPSLEILLPAHAADDRLLQTVASLVSQSDRQFTVLLNEKTGHAAKPLSAAGIAIRHIATPFEMKRLELWNWLHSQAQADWLKLALPGEILHPEYVAALRERIQKNPKARLVRCDAELQTDWGIETIRAPFSDGAIPAAEFSRYFPAGVDWICQAGNVAYSRLAWVATGGYSNQLPGFASLNLNVTLALHHGLENVPEPLVRIESPDRLPLNESRGERINYPLELWLVLRQARNYCLAAGLPWRCRWPWRRALLAGLGHW